MEDHSENDDILNLEEEESIVVKSIWALHRHREQTCGCQEGGGGGGKDWEFGLSRCTLLHKGWVNDKVLLYSTGNYSQWNIMEKNIKKNVYICKTESLCCTAEINTTL